MKAGVALRSCWMLSFGLFASACLTSAAPRSDTNERSWIASLRTMVSPLFAGEEARVPAASGLSRDLPRVVYTGLEPLRTLRSDFEPPETLLVVYDSEWTESIIGIVRAALGQSAVALLVRSRDVAKVSSSELSRFDHVQVLRTELDSPWVRDYGPVQSLDDQGTLWIDFDYTWTRPADDRMPRWLSRHMQARVEMSDSSFDGGAVISNGDGLCAVGSGALLEAGFRGAPVAELESFFQHLGCHATALLPEVPGERTGHADMIAQFVSAEHVLVAALDGAFSEEAARRLDEAAQALTAAASRLDRRLRVTRVPIVVERGNFYSYVNVTRLASRLLVPHFDGVDEADQRRAYAVLRRALYGVELAPIPADKLIRHGGAVHCATLGLGAPHQKRRVRRARRRLEHG